MRLSLKNIGMINDADVDINGLTVIAGKNDTGKSTIGKTLYSIIKSINNTEDFYKKELFHSISQLSTFVMNQHRRVLKQIEVKNPKQFDDLYEKFFIRSRYFDRQLIMILDNNFLSQNLPQPLNELKDLIDKYETECLENSEKIRSYLTEKIKNGHNYRENIEEYISRLKDKFSKIKKNLNKKPEDEDLRIDSFNRYIISVFDKNICNVYKLKNDTNSQIKMFDEINEQVSINIKDNKAESFFLKDYFPFKDITIIESSAYLNVYNSILKSKSTFEVSEDYKSFRYPNQSIVLDYIKDFIEKLSFINPDNIEFKKDISDFFNSILEGSFYFDKEEQEFIFKRGNINFKLINLASGIKSIGVFLLLLLNTHIDNTLFILDEPENHLHPEFQLKYAELLVRLVKGDFCNTQITVVLTSHSPYFIEAIEYYSRKYNIEKLTSFYFANRIKNSFESSFDDVSNDLTPIFEALSKPLDTFDE